MSGRLTLVATPIGNLDDMSPRAVKAMRDADLLLCEDTRHTAKLAQAFGISTAREAFHEHNENARTPEMLARLRAGAKLALVSDAGTPLINDPGYKLVRDAIAAGITVTAIPGPVAPVVALILSGLPPTPFAVFGFPPAKPGARQRFIDELAAWPYTLACLISPHRGADELAAMTPLLGSRPGVLARELTKTHETLHRGTVAELATLAAGDQLKGEWTLIVGPPPAPAAPELDALVERALAAAAGGQSLKAASQKIAAAENLPWRHLYKAALAAKTNTNNTTRV